MIICTAKKFSKKRAKAIYGTMFIMKENTIYISGWFRQSFSTSLIIC